MRIRYLRTIILVFALLTACVGWFFIIKAKGGYFIDFKYPLIVISFVCLLLFGLSYISLFKRKTGIIAFAFKLSVVIWFITLAALNRFSAEYSYSLILIVFMLSLIDADVKKFIFFYALSIISFVISLLLIKEIIIEPYSFLMLFIANGVMMFYILRVQEKNRKYMDRAQLNASAILHSTTGFFFFLDKNFTIISFNKLAEEIYRNVMNMELKEGNSIFQYMPPGAHDSLRQTLVRCLNGEIIKNEKIADFPGGPKVWVENTFVPVYDDNKKFLGISFQTVNIDERKNAASLIEHQNKFLQTLLDTIPNPVFYKDEKGRYIGCNKSFENNIGGKQEDFIGKSVFDLSPKELAEVYFEKDKELLENPGIQEYEAKVKYLDGSTHDVIFHKATFEKHDGTIGGLVGIILDITEKKKAEEEIKASLREKEVLLSEIHHRVKNNLQVISSMLRLQSHSITDPTSHEVFLDAQHRIITMGLVHEKLYKAENFSKINVKDYIKDLVESVSDSYNPEPDRIKVTIDVDPVLINLDTMIPLGLILNELLTNCMKYAFPENQNGLITVRLKKLEDAKFSLCVCDNGVGIPKQFDMENIQSLGLRLVQTLTDQINGNLCIENNNGCTFSIKFSEFEKKMKNSFPH